MASQRELREAFADGFMAAKFGSNAIMGSMNLEAKSAALSAYPPKTVTRPREVIGTDGQRFRWQDFRLEFFSNGFWEPFHDDEIARIILDLYMRPTETVEDD